MIKKLKHDNFYYIDNSLNFFLSQFLEITNLFKIYDKGNITIVTKIGENLSLNPNTSINMNNKTDDIA